MVRFLSICSTFNDKNINSLNQKMIDGMYTIVHITERNFKNPINLNI